MNSTSPFPTWTIPRREPSRRAARKLPGIISVRIVGRGAYLRYRANTLSHTEICETLRRAGFRARTFQNSKSGDAGKSSQ